MRAAHDVERIRRCHRVDQRAEIGGLGRRQLFDLEREPVAGLVCEATAQASHALEDRRVIERAGPGDPQQPTGSGEQLDPGADVRPDPFCAGPVSVVDDEEVLELRLELLERLTLNVGQPVEVPKDRRHRDAGPLGDVVDRRGHLAILHQREAPRRSPRRGFAADERADRRRVDPLPRSTP